MLRYLALSLILSTSVPSAGAAGTVAAPTGTTTASPAGTGSGSPAGTASAAGTASPAGTGNASPGMAGAAQGAAEPASADPRVALLKLLPAGAKLDELKPSPLPGIYEFMQGADVSYLTADGKYFIDGNVYDMKTRDNLTEELRTRARVAMINAVPESLMLIFSPPSPKYTITVFTDVDCAYCRKLHSEMAELNRLGIRVRYMFFPRTGPGSESWHKAEVVWCSQDRNATLTRAKAGAVLDLKQTCADTPVAREYALGESVGVRGTPAIFTESGDYISGYMEPRELVKQLKELQLARR